MPDDLKKKIPQDAKRIDLSEPYEVEYWTDKFDCEEKELKKVIDDVGDSVDAVKRELIKCK